ncbi:hypothetical protein ABK040_004925 [Willaertia magna]
MKRKLNKLIQSPELKKTKVLNEALNSEPKEREEEEQQESITTNNNDNNNNATNNQIEEEEEDAEFTKQLTTKKKEERKAIKDLLNNYNNFELDEPTGFTFKKIIKNIYQEHPSIKALKNEEEIRKKEDIKIFCSRKGMEIPKPVLLFSQINFPPFIQNLIKENNFKEPTAIQKQTWPVVLKGFDLIGLAETGSGKTLAYLLPGIMHVLEQDDLEKGEGPVMCILIPTRELALQINEECEKICKLFNQLQNQKQGEQQQKRKLKVACLYGGEVRKSQIKECKARPQIVIATPGRLLDFLQADITNMKRCTYLVLDEADRMLDMGFNQQINQVVGQITPQRQTLFFSATWNRSVQAMAMSYISKTEPHFIVNIGSIETSANHNVKQSFLFIQDNDKLTRLLNLLDNIVTDPDDCRTLIFCKTKKRTDVVTQKLRENGWPSLSIHGERKQEEREWVLNEFKSGETPILIATDIAARGLHVDNVKFVINYDMPHEIDSYVHRIGRTGRAGKEGNAISFFTPTDLHLAGSLIKILQESEQEIPERLQKLHELATKSHGELSLEDQKAKDKLEILQKK